MKIRPYERSTLWRSAFGKRRDDPDERDRTALADAYRQLRDRAGDLVGEIHAKLPHLTVHDLTHADTLWDVASEICGPRYQLNPLAGFVLGASFLLHDAGMALAAYPGGVSELKLSAEWRDAIASAWKRRGVDDPNDGQRTSPTDDVFNEATFNVLRSRHASQAKILATALWTQPATGIPLKLVQNDDLLESYGELIGNISASHHWPISEIARFFGDSTPASAAWPREWDVDGLALACILRCADASAIDETRAPSFLFAIRQPEGISKRHWSFQNKIYPAKRRNEVLIFESKSPFLLTSCDDWWLCFDAIEMADRELKTSDALLRDRQREPLAARRVLGGGEPDILLRTIRVEGWKPVNTQPKISNPQSIIERLGGKQLYGDDPVVPIRELIQNAVDAIRARRFIDPFFQPTESDKFPGKILLEIKNIVDTDEYWIAVEDDGIGMSERVMTGPLLDFGTSFWSSELAAKLYPGLPSAKGFRPTGRFGIGFFSIFMYSDEAVVMSREFRSAKDRWNVLSFDHGVRHRGNFETSTAPNEIKMLDASTRVKIKVNKDFLWSLRMYNLEYLPKPPGGIVKEIAEIKERLVLLLRTMLCALDVRISLRCLDQEEICLNSPPLYEKGDSEICVVLRGLLGNSNDNFIEKDKQRKMLMPLGDCSGKIYGYCALSIDFRISQVFKSVGGMVYVSRYRGGRDEPICGVAEYNVTSANREPDNISAPVHVLDAWLKKQMEFVNGGQLTEYERTRAVACVENLGKDVKPIFFVSTSEGGMGLDELIIRIRKYGYVMFPVQSYGFYSRYSCTLPEVDNLLHFKRDNIVFHKFCICGSVEIDRNFDYNKSSMVWRVIIDVLGENGLKTRSSYRRAQQIGVNKNVDSGYHKLSIGDPIQSDIVIIEIED